MAQTSGDDRVPVYPACVDDEGVRALVNRLYGWSVDRVKRLPGYDDLNFFIKIKSSGSLEGSEFVTKVINSRDSRSPDRIQAETDVLLHLKERGIPCPTPVKNLNGDYFSLEEIVDKSGKQPPGLKFIVRTLVFLPGKLVRELFQPDDPVPDKYFFTMGKFLATLNKELLDFRQPSRDTLERKARDFIWSPNYFPLMRNVLWAVTDADKHKLAEKILDEFEARVVPKMGDLRQCVIHTDFNDMNIIYLQDIPAPSEAQWHTAGGLDILAEQDSWLGELGAIDFSDIVFSNLLFDVGNSQAYMMMSQPHGDPLVSGGHFLAGYNSVLPLSPTEMCLLRCCSAARLVQSLVNGLQAYSEHPDNGYVLDTQRTGWNVLQKLWSKTDQELLSMWEGIAELYRPSENHPSQSVHSKEDTNLTSNSDSKITPTLSSNEAKKLLRELYPIQAQDIKEIKQFIAYDDQNFYVLLEGGDSAARMGGREFVLKVINSEDSADRSAFDMQVAVLRYLTEKGFCCAAPVRNIHGNFLSLEEMYMSNRKTDSEEDTKKQGGNFLVFLLTFIPGETISKISLVPEQLCYDVGVKMAEMDKLLWDFPDIPDGFKNRASGFIWAMESHPMVRQHLDEVKDARRRGLVDSVFKTFEEEVWPKISTLRKCIIHSDYNAENILVTKTSSGLGSLDDVTYDRDSCDSSPPTKKTKGETTYSITGVIDFTDIVYSCLIFEIAQAMAFVLYWKAADPTSATAHLLAGFQSVIPLTTGELEVLYICMVTHLAKELVLSLYNHRLQPDNPHIMMTQGRGWRCLEELWGDPNGRARIEKLWKDTADMYKQETS